MRPRSIRRLEVWDGRSRSPEAVAAADLDVEEHGTALGAIEVHLFRASGSAVVDDAVAHGARAIGM